MSNRKGDFILTYSGIEFYPLDPHPEEILIEDIAHSLSMQCRFTGHTLQFYSVAEHSLRVTELCNRWKLWGLLHDAPEAYLVDLPRPIKRCSALGELYCEIEDHLMFAICLRFGLHWPIPPSIQDLDKAMLYIESQALMPPHPCWDKWKQYTTGRERPIGTTLLPEQAEHMFLDVAKKLGACK